MVPRVGLNFKTALQRQAGSGVRLLKSDHVRSCSRVRSYTSLGIARRCSPRSFPSKKGSRSRNSVATISRDIPRSPSSVQRNSFAESTSALIIADLSPKLCLAPAHVLPSDRSENDPSRMVRWLCRLKRSTECSSPMRPFTSNHLFHGASTIRLVDWLDEEIARKVGREARVAEGGTRAGGRAGRMEGSKVARLRQGGGWPEVSRWSRGRCRGSNKLPPQTSFHVTSLTSLYGYRGQPCNLINCHGRTERVTRN